MRLAKISDISPGMFLSATQYREIVKARILSREEKKTRVNGSPDVELITWANEKFYITRSELVSNFLDVTGRKLNVRTWKNNQTHIVECSAKKLCGVLHIPNSKRFGVVSINGKKYKPGTFVVCMKNQDGDLDYNTCRALTPELFHKMFSVNENVENLANKVKRDIKLKEIRNSGNTKAKVRNENGTTVMLDKELSLAKYVVVAKIVNMNTDKIVGYVISYNGKRVNCSLNKVEKLCKEKKIKNMTVVYNNGSVPYFRCIGMTQESLETTYIR